MNKYRFNASTTDPYVDQKVSAACTGLSNTAALINKCSL